MTDVSISPVPDMLHHAVQRKGYRQEQIPCCDCGVPRTVTGFGVVRFQIAARCRCRSCAASLAERTKSATRAAYVDWAAVERLMTGKAVKSTSAEKAEAVARLTMRGFSASTIAELMHVTERSVQRHRAAQRVTYQEQDEVA